jgi:hypothetical protein
MIYYKSKIIFTITNLNPDLILKKYTLTYILVIGIRIG